VEFTVRDVFFSEFYFVVYDPLYYGVPFFRVEFTVRDVFFSEFYFVVYDPFIMGSLQNSLAQRGI
jgi:hypothetical protein